MAAGLTRPTPAHQDAPFRRHGPSERRGESYSLRYVESLSDARTKPADFFSILLELHVEREIGASKDQGRIELLLDMKGTNERFVWTTTHADALRVPPGTLFIQKTLPSILPHHHDSLADQPTAGLLFIVEASTAY